MNIALWIVAGVVDAGASLYFALRYREFLPLLGTSFVFTPLVNGARSIMHFIFFGLCFYFGFVSKPKTITRE